MFEQSWKLFVIFSSRPSSVVGWMVGWLPVERVDIWVGRGRWWVLWVVHEPGLPVGMADESELRLSLKSRIISVSWPNSVGIAEMSEFPSSWNDADNFDSWPSSVGIADESLFDQAVKPPVISDSLPSSVGIRTLSEFERREKSVVILYSWPSSVDGWVGG